MSGKRKRAPLLDNVETSRLASTFSAIERRDGGQWLDGVVFAPEGTVSVYSSGAAASYRMSFGGRFFYRYERHGRTARGLAIMARRFARQCAESSHV